MGGGTDTPVTGLAATDSGLRQIVIIQLSAPGFESGAFSETTV